MNISVFALFFSALVLSACGGGTVAPPVGTPQSPSIAMEAKSTNASLTWEPVSGATYYKVYRDGALLPAATKVIKSSFLDTDLITDKNYVYQIQACDDKGCSELSSKLCSVTKLCVQLGRLEVGQVHTLKADDTYQGDLVPGRAALVRAYVEGSDSSGANIAAPKLSLTRSYSGDANASVVTPMTCPATLPSKAMNGSTPISYSRGSSCEAWLPAEAVTAGLSVKISTADTAIEQSIKPKVGSKNSINILKIPVDLNGNLGSLPSDASVREAVLKIMPFANVFIKTRAAWHPRGSYSINLSSMNGCPTTPSVSSAWTCVLQQLQALHAIETDGSTYYYFGFVPYTKTFSSFTAGIAFSPGEVALGLDTSLPKQISVMLHELGHNLSLAHAPCSSISDNPPYLDPFWLSSTSPWAGAQYARLDPSPRILGGPSSWDLAKPSNLGDGTSIMAYCEGQWFSSYEYKKMADHVASAAKTGLHTAPMMVSQNQTALAFQLNNPSDNGFLMIQGRVHQGRVQFSPVLSLSAARQTPSSGSYELRLISSDGVVRLQRLNLMTVGHSSDGASYFTVVVPALADLDRLELAYNDIALPTEAALAPPAASAVSSPKVDATPTISHFEVSSKGFNRINQTQGKVAVSWDAANYPWASLTHLAANGQRTVIWLQETGGTVTTALDPFLQSGGRWELSLSNGIQTKLIFLTQ